MATENDPSAQGASGDASSSAQDHSEGFRKLLKKHQDDGVRLAETLYGENFQLREKLRIAEDRVPGDGAIILRGDDAKRWASYRELGEPGDVRKSLKQGAEAEAEAGKFRRAEHYGEVAGLAKLNPKAFQRLAEQDQLAVEIKTEGKGDKEARVPYVKGVDDEGQETLTPITKYAETHWAEFLPSLQGGERQEPQRSNGTPRGRNPNGPPPPPGEKGDPIEQHIRRSGIVSF